MASDNEDEEPMVEDQKSGSKKKKKKSSKKESKKSTEGEAEGTKPKSGKKKSKKSTKEEDEEDKPKSSKKKKDKKEKKESKSSKKSSKNDTQLTAANATLVSEASGWNQLDVKKDPGAKYGITGNESQVLTIALAQGEVCVGEPGTMLFLTPGVTQTAQCAGCCTRCLSGESCCTLSFTNTGPSEKGFAALTPNALLGKVVPVDLSSPEVGGALIAQQGSYMAHYGEVNIAIDCDCNFMRCCCGGVGLVRQKIDGTGTVFLGGTGTIVQKVLKPEEVMVIDTNCILAFSEKCKLEIKKAGSVMGMLGGGEGIFNTTLTGPGLAVVQSMSEITFLNAMTAQKIAGR